MRFLRKIKARLTALEVAQIRTVRIEIVAPLSNVLGPGSVITGITEGPRTGRAVIANGELTIVLENHEGH